MPFGLKSVGAM
jgi:hypothetical protein